MWRSFSSELRARIGMVKVRVWCVRLTFFFCLFHLTAASAAPGILSPPDGSVLSGSSETFTWSADGTVIDRWRLEVGTAPDTVNLFASSFASSITSVQVNGLPTDGSSVHVNLKWRVNGVVSVASYVYTAFDDSVPPANVAPTVSAGVDQAIALPIDTVTLSGVATDDGLPLGALNLTWSMLSGPAAVSFLDPTQASTSATFVTPGDYVLQLNASDTLLNTSDQMSVTVHASAVLTTIQVTPGSTVLLANETQQFVATGLDQTGEPYAITPDWAATGGSIDTAGLYAAGVVTGQFEVAPSAASVFGQADIFIVDNLGPWPTNGWQSAIPSDAEMEQSLLEQARDYALTGGGAGMITRHGQLVMSWGDTSRLYDVNSVTKSIGALLLGLAVKDSIVTLSDLAQTHYPAVGANPTTNVSTGWLNEITVMNLATHSAGFAKPAGYVDMLVQPGTAWAYSDAGFNWLADTLTVANQSDLLPILDSRILSPLGVTTADYSWSNSVHRDTLVEGFVRREFNSSIDISVDAMARVGYLALRNGSWDSQNIIQPAFIDQMQATVPGVTGLPVSNDLDSKYGGAPEHYGIGWWNNADGALPNVPTDAYWAWGVGDFLILVIPSLDIVASRAGTPWAGSRTPSYYPVLGPFFDPIAQSVTTFGNEAPTVDAGFDDSITLPTTTLNLVGIVSDDGLPDGTLDITWSQIAGPATVVFGNETLAATAATFTDSGDYTLRLTATDGLASASDDVLITVLPEPDSELPVVAITQPISNDTVSGLVTVTATATDNDSVVDVEFFAAGVSIGVDATSPYSVIWNSTVATDGDHDIAAFGRDPAGNESGDSIMVTVDNAAAANQPPVVGAGVGGVITLPTDTIGLGGTAIDDGLPSGSLTTTWSAINPPFAVTFADASALTTTATFAGSGSYLLRLTADDGALTASADVTVTVNPDLTTDPQTFVAIADNTINGAQPTRVIGGGTVVQLHGFGPKVGLVQFDLSSLTGSSVSAASFRFRLNALKSNGNIDIQLVEEAWTEDTVNYENQPAFSATVVTVPVTTADVGTVMTVDVTGVVQSWAEGSIPSHGFRLATSQGINASIDSRESSGTPMDLHVTVELLVDTESPIVIMSRPAQGSTVSGVVSVAATATDNIAIASVSFAVGATPLGTLTSAPYELTWDTTTYTNGAHQVTAIATDTSGNTGSSLVNVTLNNVNVPPVVDAGAGGVITLPTDTIGLSGTAFDDGLPSGSLTTTWSAINPPFAVTFADANALTTTATFAGSGSYLLRLTADDGALTASADVTVTVNPDLTTDPQTFVAIADNTINGAQPTRVIGGGTVVQAHGFGPKVGLVQFDLSSLTGSSVSAASFRFRLSSLASNGDISIQLVDEAWSEDSVNYDNQPSFGATVLTVPVTMADVGTVLSVDVTGIVQSWVDGSQPSHGFRLATSQSINASMDSRESSGIPMDLLVTVDNGVSTVSAPSISPNGGSSATPVQVTLATVTPGASIYYTLDGSIPTSGSNSYTAPFTLDASATVKARATAPGLSDSVVVSADFVINSALTGDLNNYWSLNEIVGASYANNVGSTAGTCINCPTPTSGLVNGAQSFDGTNDVISVADDGSADWVLTAGFTVEFWVNKNNACTAREVVVGRHDGGTAMQWAVGCDSGTAFFELTDANGTSATAMGSSAIDDGAWHHIVAVYDAFYDEIRLYKDGGLDASASVTYATGFASAADITIGELQNGLSDTFFNGIVDEVALHDRAIPVSLIARHHLDGSIGLHGGYTGCSAPVKFMPLGDSNTNRLGYRPTLYFDLIDRGLDVDFVGSHSDNPTAGTHDRDHEGWSGFTTTDIAANLDGWLSGNPPDVVFLHIGTNDIDIVTAAEAIIGLAGILDIIHAFDPDITVVLGQIINRQTFSQETADYNEQMVALAQTKLAAGYRILLVDHENALAYPDDMVDLEHANDSGYAKMAGVWLDGATDFLPACNAAAPIFRSIASSSGQVAIEYRYQPTVLGNPVARFTALTSPAGMRVHPDTGEVRWVPSAAGQYNVDLQIQNSAGSQVQGFILTIP